jgi:hypothetical protein
MSRLERRVLAPIDDDDGDDGGIDVSASTALTPALSRAAMKCQHG